MLINRFNGLSYVSSIHTHAHKQEKAILNRFVVAETKYLSLQECLPVEVKIRLQSHTLQFPNNNFSIIFRSFSRSSSYSFSLSTELWQIYFTTQSFRPTISIRYDYNGSVFWLVFWKHTVRISFGIWIILNYVLHVHSTVLSNKLLSKSLRPTHHQSLSSFDAIRIRGNAVSAAETAFQKQRRI